MRHPRSVQETTTTKGTAASLVEEFGARYSVSVGQGTIRAQREECQERTRTRSVRDDNRSPPTTVKVASGHPVDVQIGRKSRTRASAGQHCCCRDPSATITSIDGISAYDTISRTAMLSGLAEVDPAVLPFVRLFCRSESRFLWEDNEGNGHTITQAEGGEQDPLMPSLFALGQHRALAAVHARLLPSESLMAYMDDNVHTGKTRVWNAAGIGPYACDVFEQFRTCVD